MNIKCIAQMQLERVNAKDKRQQGTMNIKCIAQMQPRRAGLLPEWDGGTMNIKCIAQMQLQESVQAEGRSDRHNEHKVHRTDATRPVQD